MLRILGFLAASLAAWATWEVSAWASKPTSARDRAAQGDAPPAGAEGTDGLAWQEDYAVAMRLAERESKMLLIYFRSPEPSEASRRFEPDVLTDRAVLARLARYVRLRLPTDATITVGGKRIELLRHHAFSEMSGRPGVAIVDYRDEGRVHYGQVVSAFPLADDHRLSPQEMAVILDLPPGTLTQRTLIFAVRTHPEKPASTAGHPDPYLASEAQRHSQHQARIRRQGHHGWEHRFHQVNARLPDGLLASEVCAESWPGMNLVAAAVDCVRSWRYSEGHWSAVKAEHGVYGYDMKRGANGIWYATGIFGRRY